MASKRSQEIRAEKAKAQAKGHDMGNAVNVSPFACENTPPGQIHYAVCTACRRCNRSMYIQKEGDTIRSWGGALSVGCKSIH